MKARSICKQLSSVIFRRFLSIQRSHIQQRISNSNYLYSVSDEVANALHTGRPVVALESTVITHGLPYPINYETGRKLEDIVRSEQAVPATISLMDGRIYVGLSDEQLLQLSRPEPKQHDQRRMKCSVRDLPACLRQRKIGGTTVAATMWIAGQLGIKVFATGGIGGVHRCAESMPISQLGRTPVAVVCAGAKSILDISKTLEYLETQSVNVCVYGEDAYFPGFFLPKTPHKAPCFSNDLKNIADMMRLHFDLCLPHGMLVACPLPDEVVGHAQIIESAIERALDEARNKGVSGKELTPFLLSRIDELTGSVSKKLNIQLLENNARVASKLASLLIEREKGDGLSNTTRSRFTVDRRSNEESLPKTHKKNVVCVGAAIVDFEVFTSDPPCQQGKGSTIGGGLYNPAKILQKCGGVARNHCDALNRLGCPSSLISIFGCDPLSEFLKINGRHMDLQHVLEIGGVETASSMSLISSTGQITSGFLSVDHVIDLLTPDFIYSKSHVFADSDYVLVDANLNAETIKAVLELSNSLGKKVWFEPTNALKVHKIVSPKNLLGNVTILSPNLAEFKAICRAIGTNEKLAEQIVSASRDPDICRQIAIPDSLFPENILYFLLTMDECGVALIRHAKSEKANTKSSHEIIFCPPPTIDPCEIVSTSGSGDCFNSGFLAAHIFDKDIFECLRFGSLCAIESLKGPDPVPESLCSLTVRS